MISRITILQLITVLISSIICQVTTEKRAVMSLTLLDAELSCMNQNCSTRFSDIHLDPFRFYTPIVKNRCSRKNYRSKLFRTADGTCNNIFDPMAGQSNGRFKRYMPHQYEDGACTPKTRGVNGGYLSSPRTISKRVHTDIPLRADHTVLLMAWGQFIDHDLTATTAEQPSDPNACCSNAEVLNGSLHPDTNTCSGLCFPIVVPDGDTSFEKCIIMTRSNAIQDFSDISESDPREQVNMLTSFIDASSVYGSDEQRSNELRANDGEDGRMATSAGNLLPRGRNEDCILGPGAPYCFAAGDDRVDVFPTLAAFHTIFVRLHNQIVDVLDCNTCWNGEKLFQETRKIVGALLQRITYFEWLPNILSPFTLNQWNLREGNHTYDITRDPRISAEFATAAFRMGHSLIPDSLRFGNERILSRNLFNNPKTIFENITLLMEGAITEPAKALDRFVTREVTNHLFETEQESFDLVSFNINRGRDHGIATYNQMREFCGLNKITSFTDSALGGAGSDLAAVYDHVDDIELFPGGMSEPQLPNSLLGETFNCIIGQQFSDLKDGDSFWHETQDKRRRFSTEQLKSLRKYSLARILCDTLDLDKIQPDPFKLPNYTSNQRKSCSEYDALDLSPWYACKQFCNK